MAAYLKSRIAKSGGVLVPQGLKPAFLLDRSGAAEQAAEECSLPEKRRAPAAKAESVFSDLRYAYEAYPDTNRELFRSL